MLAVLLSFTVAWLTDGTIVGISGIDNNQWRIPLGVQVIPAGILAAMILPFPESPRWLIDHDRNEESLQTLADCTLMATSVTLGYEQNTLALHKLSLLNMCRRPKRTRIYSRTEVASDDYFW